MTNQWKPIINLIGNLWEISSHHYQEESIADKAGLTKKEAEKALKAFTDTVAEELAKGGKVQLVGFGTFEVSERAARIGINPHTRQPLTIEASKTPKFKGGKALKDAIN